MVILSCSNGSIVGDYSKSARIVNSGSRRHEDQNGRRAEPVATANGRKRPWLISNVRQNMKNATIRVAVVIGAFALVSCRGPQWVCGTAMLENALEEESFQSLPFVLCEHAASAEFKLVVTVEIPGVYEKREATLFFRSKFAGEKATLRQHEVRLPPGYSPDTATVSIRGKDLSLAVSVRWGDFTSGRLGESSVRFPIEFMRSFSSTDGGVLISGVWRDEKRPNQSPEPTAGLRPAAAHL